MPSSIVRKCTRMALAAFWLAAVSFTVSPPVRAIAAPAKPDFSSNASILHWLARYHGHGRAADVPDAARAMSRAGAFHNPDGAGVFVGFLAGVIGHDPDAADAVVAGLAALPPEDQWVAVRAIAWSGHPEWRAMLRRLAPRLPGRSAMIEHYLAGRTPTLQQLSLATSNPTIMQKLRGYLAADKDAPRKPTSLAPTPDLLDALWGYYFATGTVQPVGRLMAMLPWAKERDASDRLTLGAMAKLTLASNAARDPELLALLKRARPHQRKAVAAQLDEVIEAAETVQVGPIRTQALAAIEEIKTKGSASHRNVAWWSRLGESAIALGCIGAAAAGQVQLGLPCVVGGAVSSAVMKNLGAGG